MRAANIPKIEKIISFVQIKLILSAFLVICGPEKLVSNKLRPAEHFFCGLWPSDKFEFETPGLCVNIRIRGGFCPSIISVSNVSLHFNVN